MMSMAIAGSHEDRDLADLPWLRKLTRLVSVRVVLMTLLLLVSVSHYISLTQQNASLVHRHEHLLDRVNNLEIFTRDHMARNTTNAHILLEMEDIRSSFGTIQEDMNQIESRVKTVAAEAHHEIEEEVRMVKADMDVYIRVTNTQLSAESNFVRYQIAGTFTLLACLISVFSITSHLRNLNKPDVQRRILAILYMVPIYAVTSWLSLVFPVGLHIFAAVRDMYEAYCVYTFIAFLIAVVGEESGLSGARLKIEQHLMHEDLDTLDTLDTLEDVDVEEGQGNRTEWGSSTASSADTRTESSSSPSPPSLPRHTATSSSSSSAAICEDSPDSGEANESTFTASVEDLNYSSPGRRASMAFARRASMMTPSGPMIHARTKHHIKPPFSCCCYDDRADATSRAAAILFQCQVLALQFVLLKPLLAIVPLILVRSGVDYYGTPMMLEGSLYLPNLASARMHMHVVLNISVACAFYALLCFYHTVETDLSWCDPWPKFVAIKMVVFVTFWQQAALNVMNGAGIVDEESARAAQDLLVCIEMLVAALAFYYVFPYQEWVPGYKKKKQDYLIMESLALSDFVSDIRGVIGRNAFQGIKTSPQSSEGEEEDGYRSATWGGAGGAPMRLVRAGLGGMFKRFSGLGSPSPALMAKKKDKESSDDFDNLEQQHSSSSSSSMGLSMPSTHARRLVGDSGGGDGGDSDGPTDGASDTEEVSLLGGDRGVLTPRHRSK